ncbi:hypothetical protein [uncultured Sulfitobacter sp.]|uniref:hypothetical protein n=1 Tax=uncultured Sulfitobacter sp. TaxID=191468 RepID=UPI00260735F6|nr:hypothetical protein [uncultured Sulfitobacter sp.]
MNRTDPSTKSLQLLAQQILDVDPQPLAPKLSISVWQAMSMLQKAIRRNDSHRTAVATSTLLNLDAERFWRRLGVIAFEDVGVSNLPLVYAVTAALAGKRVRGEFGGDTRVAMALAQCLANSAKNRSADDLLCIRDQHPDARDMQHEFQRIPTERLRSIFVGCPEVLAQASAAKIIAARSPKPHISVEVELLENAGAAPAAIALFVQGKARVRNDLPFLVALLTLQNGLRSPNPDDVLPAEIEFAGMPGWALDMFTREGKAAIRRLLAHDNALSQYIRRSFPSAGRTQLLGEAIFRVEGGLLRKRQDGALGQQLRQIMELECMGIHPHQAREVLRLTSSNLELLNSLRRQVVWDASNG